MTRAASAAGPADRRTVELVFPEGTARFTVSRFGGAMHVVGYRKSG